VTETSPLADPQVSTAASTTPIPPAPVTNVFPEPPPSPAAFDFATGLTYHRADGNRLASGLGAVPVADPLDIPLDGRPIWVVAAPLGQDSVWVAVLDDGRVQSFQLSGRDAIPITLSPEVLPLGMPPVLFVDGDLVQLLSNPSAEASTLTHPVRLTQPSDRIVFLETLGDLVIWDGREISRLPVTGLPDARILADEKERLLFLAGPSTRYQHGVLGDAVEATTITSVEISPTVGVARRIEVEEPDVIEGIAPIWADLTGDGRREIIVTLSNETLGARIAVYDEAGRLIASSAPIGRGFRWRHQLAVAPFGPGGELELAAVLTPHIGGHAEFFRLSGDRLELVASAAGFSSHVLGSRNLDIGLAGDFDGDGQVELVVPDQTLQTLNGVRRISQGADIAWTVPVGGRITTNLAAVTMAGGRLVMGSGHDDRTLRIWLP
jgi:hypothetical protein